MWCVSPITWILQLPLQLSKKIRDAYTLLLTSAISLLENCNILQAIFPASMPWPITLAPTNEAIRQENMWKKTYKKKIINSHEIWEVMLDVKIVLQSISTRFVESSRKLFWLLDVHISTI
jgi:hypothetical protein